MTSRILSAMLIAPVLAGLVLASVDGPSSGSESVDPGVATSVTVKVSLPQGSVTAEAGTRTLASVKYTVPAAGLVPVLDYEETAETGTVTVAATTTETYEEPCTWDIAFHEELVHALEVTVGKGEVDLELAGTALERVVATVTEGDLTVDMSGDWAHALAGARFEVGKGDLTIVVPAGVGVRVVPKTELADLDIEDMNPDGVAWVNDAWRRTDINMEVTAVIELGTLIVTQGE